MIPAPASVPDFRALFESAPGACLALTPDLVICAASHAYLAVTMTRREDILGLRIFEAFPDDPARPGADGVANLAESLHRVIEMRRPDAMAVQRYDIHAPGSADGSFEPRFWSAVNTPVLDADGGLAYIIHRVEDVTGYLERRALAEAANRDALQLVGTEAHELEVELDCRAQEIQRANRELREIQKHLEQRVDERTRELQRANESLLREVEERRRAEEALRKSEEQFRQAQKMEAVGRLAGGIAHDFNNLLTVILSYSEFIQLADVDEDSRQHLAEIGRAARRAAALTRQLLAFSRQQVLEPVILDANEVLRGVQEMLLRVLGEDVDLRLILRSKAGRLHADRGQFEQVVMNLVVNARDAMPSGGLLTIETEDVELSEDFARGHLGVAPGPYVMVAVSDTGHGMDRETQARVFEPFFTTKDRGKGTGLGLSTVFGIVKQSGGSIWLYSEPGAGTTFKIYLPRVDGAAAAASVASVPARQVSGRETVLLVEDDDQVRAVASGILQRAGHLVLETANADEAIAVVQRHPERIDLLLTDVVMPGMNGRALWDRVRSARPDMRVLFMSGYTDDVVLRHGVLDAGVAYVQKPLTPDLLIRKVREALAAQA